MFHLDHVWLKSHDERNVITTPYNLIPFVKPVPSVDNTPINRIMGSIVGLAIGDALGAPVEFRPYEYLQEKPVTDFQNGGTWSLKKGQVSLFPIRSKHRNNILNFA